MGKDDNPPPNPAEQPPPAGGPEVDDAKLGAAVEAAIRKLFAESKPPAGGDPAPPATPPAGTPPAGAPAAPAAESGSIGAMISAAVNAALKERDQEDALAVLAAQIDDLKQAITRAPAARKRGWGSILLGPGLSGR